MDVVFWLSGWHQATADLCYSWSNHYRPVVYRLSFSLFWRLNMSTDHQRLTTGSGQKWLRHNDYWSEHLMYQVDFMHGRATWTLVSCFLRASPICSYFPFQPGISLDDEIQSCPIHLLQPASTCLANKSVHSEAGNHPLGTLSWISIITINDAQLTLALNKIITEWNDSTER